MEPSELTENLGYYFPTQAQRDQLLANYCCPNCQRLPSEADFSWQTGSTGNGTNYSTVNLICARCDTAIAEVRTWYFVEDYDEALYVLSQERPIV